MILRQVLNFVIYWYNQAESVSPIQFTCMQVQMSKKTATLA